MSTHHVGVLPGPLQGSARDPPALVLHHHLQRGQTLHEEQAPGEGEPFLRGTEKSNLNERILGSTFLQQIKPTLADIIMNPSHPPHTLVKYHMAPKQGCTI